MCKSDESCWFLVDDELPQDDKLYCGNEQWPYVLTVWKKRDNPDDPGLIEQALWFHKKFVIQNMDSDNHTWMVTHWMYLPDLPCAPNSKSIKILYLKLKRKWFGQIVTTALIILMLLCGCERKQSADCSPAGVGPCPTLSPAVLEDW